MADLESLDDTDRTARRGLSEKQQEQLSKALFPETHLVEVEVLGETRDLRPLPIKFARRLHATLKPVTKKIEQHSGENAKTKALDIDTELLDGCLKAARILAEFYKWEDVQSALKTEDIQFEEVQTLLVHQSALQKANDFLLTPLRVAVGTMRFAEVAALNYQNSVNGPRSSNNIAALLTNSSLGTPTHS